ncbi:hypothetical protein IV203_003794 [Nitzschia inconspicua]|uniref:Uncharacterized protein n=1 Tax=Nitzschia inconspicua TaxID=303405 RepID=A0A9K3L3Z0_9STRA|nr:hypothetical protein IV203_003794 [Nitzschia inconspicua]
MHFSIPLTNYLLLASSWGGLAQEQESIKRLRKTDTISDRVATYLRADSGTARKLELLDSDGTEGELWNMYVVEQIASLSTAPSPSPPTTEPPRRCEDVDCTNLEERCDPLDGVCKLLDSIVPCIAIIDESDNFPDSHFDAQWTTFRADYPDRPFCLLRPIRDNSLDRLYLPPPFLNDTRVTYAEVSRDDLGTNSLIQPVPTDWFSICGFSIYNGTTVEFIGMFLDTSGSMTESTVSESLALFEENAADAGLTIEQVFNTREDWITPFLTTLVPSS